MDTTKSSTTKSLACRIGRHHWAPQPIGRMFRTCTGCGHRQYGWYNGVPGGSIGTGVG